MIVTIFVAAPIIAVRHFVNQDASAHLYNAFLMQELLRGGSFATQYATFNTYAVPNSTGHWVLLILLKVLPPLYANKAILIGIFAGTVGATGFLRWSVCGEDKLWFAVLVGALLGLNSFWLIGFYNFLIGFALSIFVLGLFHRWRERMGPIRCLALAGLLVLVYLSHLVSFAILAGSICLIALFTVPGERRKALVWTILAIVPVLPLVIAFRSASESGGEFFPNWRFPGEFSGITSWFMRAVAANPFGLISKRVIPFTEVDSGFAALVSPAVWSVVVLVLLAAYIATRAPEIIRDRGRLPYMILFVSCLLATLIGPDDFGMSHGELLRGRTALFAVVFLIPLFELPAGRPGRIAIAAGFVFVIVMQTAALWEYSFAADRTGSQFLAVSAHLNDGDRVASLVLEPSPLRFAAPPAMSQLNGLNGIGREIVVWDNYELGHHLFPLIAVEPQVKKFIYDYNSLASVILDPARKRGGESTIKIAERLSVVLGADHQRITKLVLWGRDRDLEPELGKWFDLDEPVFAEGMIRVVRHK